MPSGVWEFCARIGAGATVDALWIAEPISEGVDVMDGHDAQGDPSLVFQSTVSSAGCRA